MLNDDTETEQAAKVTWEVLCEEGRLHRDMLYRIANNPDTSSEPRAGGDAAYFKKVQAYAEENQLKVHEVAEKLLEHFMG